MNSKVAKAPVVPIRQRTQYSCMAASMSMCLKALGHNYDEDTVNRVMGAAPMKGAAWEQALACAQHFGCRATLTMPATIEQLKGWTDAGIPVMIAWNPEGRPWSHASVVFDVDDDLTVYVADPNIPNPKETVRVVPENEFYGKWYEQFPDYLVRRPACAIQREITTEGRQVMASVKMRTAMDKDAKKDQPKIVPRNTVVKDLIDRGQGGQGKHKNKQDYDRGHARKPKHRNREIEASFDEIAAVAAGLTASEAQVLGALHRVGGMADTNGPSSGLGLRIMREGLERAITALASRGLITREGSLISLTGAYSGNPDGKPIYDVAIDHGEHQALAGGSDVMKRLQDQYRIEQGHGPREQNPRLAAVPPGKFSLVMATRQVPGSDPWNSPGASKKTVVVSSVSEAVSHYRAFTNEVMEAGGGGSSLAAESGQIRDHSGKVVAVISWNGRVWEPDSRGKPTNVPFRLARSSFNTTEWMSAVERVAHRYLIAQEVSR